MVQDSCLKSRRTGIYLKRKQMLISTQWWMLNIRSKLKIQGYFCLPGGIVQLSQAQEEERVIISLNLICRACSRMGRITLHSGSLKEHKIYLAHYMQVKLESTCARRAKLLLVREPFIVKIQPKILIKQQINSIKVFNRMLVILTSKFLSQRNWIVRWLLIPDLQSTTPSQSAIIESCC